MKDKILKYLIYFTLLSIIPGPLGALPLDIPTVNVYLTDIFVGSLTLVWFINWFQLVRFLKEDRIARFFLPFVVVALISLLLSPIHLSLSERVISFLYLLRFVSYFFVYVTVAYFRKKKLLTPSSILGWLGVIGIVLALIGWMQYFLYPDLRNLFYLGWDPHFKRIFSTYFDPNYFGLVMVFTLIIVFTWEESLCNTLLKLFIFTTLMFTYSRSSYLSLIAAALFYSIIEKKYKIIGSAFFIILVSIFLLPRPGGEGVKLERVFSLEQRLDNWKLGFNFFLDHPILGVGFNTVRYVRRQYGFGKEGWSISHSGAGFENSFLFVLVTTGIVGLIFYLLLIRQLFRVGNLTTKASLIAIITHNFFLNSLFFPWVMLWLWIIVASNSVKS